MALNPFMLSLLPSLLLAMASLSNAHQINDARILIYSATRDFRHDSIPTAVDALVKLGPTSRMVFDHTEDQALFTDDNLAQYDALLFLSNTGEVLDTSGKAALQTYLDKGGNFIGVHSASDALRNTTFFLHEVGAQFDYHPELQDADSTFLSHVMGGISWTLEANTTRAFSTSGLVGNGTTSTRSANSTSSTAPASATSTGGATSWSSGLAAVVTSVVAILSATLL
ncbi:trehalose utilization-domain-containing protein [Epithele typhae]|uniref:trehalose utilization-domain-containing protein n=1 Tax=Epithele typhae TaxID=378194 RepID=UPI002007F031|nr:trehalose utilization-domain-containing protein [Epithele typhae]KAH9945196.1 trehalose utilization-domain-containing protein [Epithele typhae]